MQKATIFYTSAFYSVVGVDEATSCRGALDVGMDQKMRRKHG